VNITREFITARLDRLADWRPTPVPPDAEAAAVLVPLIERDRSLSVILTLRPTTLRRHAGQISFPGGKTEPGERPWDTALREAHEEIDLDPARVDIAGLLEPLSVGGWFCATPVVGFIAPGFQPRPNPGEVEEVFEVTFDFLMNPANHRPHTVEHKGVVRHTVAMPFGDRFIWGATAHMLQNLYGRLYAPEARAS
jgi:8-oxo-dGTP pyrophosphatase MutT (NUDIX family)